MTPAARSEHTPTAGQHFLFFWRYASGFWRGRSAPAAWGLTVALAVIVLLQLLTQYLLNLWNRDFFNALERRDGAALQSQALLFFILAFAAVTLAVIAVWGRMTAQREWRRWLSKHLIDQWLVNDRYRRMTRLSSDHQNPEYRLAEDARVATDAPVDFAVGLVYSLLTAVTFIGVLWEVGGDFDLAPYGFPMVLPAYLVLAAILYAAMATIGMLVVGRNLVAIFEGKNQAESDFRHTATRVRERVSGDSRAADAKALAASLGAVMARWRDLCWQLMQTTFISHGNYVLAPVVGVVLCVPKYVAGTMTLGDVTQAAFAFFTVQGAFNWLVDNYARLADWTSSANRVGSMLVALAAADEAESAKAASTVAIPDKANI